MRIEQDRHRLNYRLTFSLYRMEYVTLLVIILASLAIIYLQKHVEQIAKNNADILQNQKKEYESEKGRNLATKEDIEEITQKIEQVKAEISFKNQWEHDHIIEREQRLVHILYLAQKISMAQNRILVMSRNAYNASKLFDMGDELHTYAVDLSHEGNLLIVGFRNLPDIDPATHLVDTLAKYAGELSCLANNVANLLQGSDTYKCMALDGKDSTIAGAENSLSLSLSLTRQAQDLTMKPLLFKEESCKAIESYILWLEKKYGEGTILTYKVVNNEE